ncbi:hypothetical protein D3C86_1968740 [compost metagenome]
MADVQFRYRSKHDLDGERASAKMEENWNILRLSWDDVLRRLLNASGIAVLMENEGSHARHDSSV